MIKKLLACALATSLFSGTVVLGAPGIELKDAERDIIKVTTSAKKGEAVSVLIVNPGYEASEVFDNGNAIGYYKKAVADSDNFSLDVPMFDTEGTGGGEYKLVVSNTDGYEETDFKFYFTEEKLRVIDLLNSAQDIALICDRLYETYSLGDSPVYKTTDKEVLAEILSKNLPYQREVQTMYDALGEALCLGAYCDGNENLTDGGALLFADVLGLSDTPLYEDYLENLSSLGIEKVNAGLLGGDYENVSDIKDKFDELVLVNLICNYKHMGFGHIPEFLEKYEDEYELAGIDGKTISESKKANTVYQAMQTSDAKTISDLKKIVSSKLKPAAESGGGGGGGGGASADVPPSSALGSVTEILPEGAGYVPNLETPFGDLAGFEWAEESVSNLYRMGAINGKSEKSFAPSDTVTRAEFTKILISAFFGTPLESEEIFSDTKGWAVPYVTYGVKMGIINGISENLFAPDENVTREQAASIVARALSNKGYTTEKKGKEFSDSKEISDWAKESVNLLSGAKVISGRGNNEFCPKDNMTRAEAAKIIYSAMKLLEGEK